MRKPGENPDLISHPYGLTCYAGSDEVKKGTYTHEVWRKYASPVWFDIRQTNTLNKEGAREEKDERHICPLQLDVIERCLTLWSKEGDTVLSPFAGIGSEGYQSIKMGRRFVGIELKPSYFSCAVKNISKADSLPDQLDLFSMEAV
jgi:DNA modification methylase